MRVGTVEYDTNAETGDQFINDIREAAVSCEQTDEKANKAMRRKFMRDLDKQVTRLLAGEISENKLVAMADKA